MSDGFLDDPRINKAAPRYETGPYEDRVNRITKKIMGQIQECDEEIGPSGFCACGNVIRFYLQKA